MLKRFFVLFFFIFSLGSCVSSKQFKTTAPDASLKEQDLIALLQASSVILVDENKFGKLRPYCSGIFISKNQILTAYHCTEDDEQISSEVGNEVYYSTILDVNTQELKVIKKHKAIVQKIDQQKDLTLLITDDSADHEFVLVAKGPISLGDRTYLVSTPVGFLFSYSEGFVSAERRIKNASNNIGLYLQTSIPASFGSSGSGLTNKNGELIGICSFMYRSLPLGMFFVHRNAIQEFLAE